MSRTSESFSFSFSLTTRLIPCNNAGLTDFKTKIRPIQKDGVRGAGGEREIPPFLIVAGICCLFWN